MIQIALELRGVRKSFGGSEIIRGIDLAIPVGEVHAVIGPNGAGKSTLFNLISGMYAPDEGEIFLDRELISGLAPSIIARRGLARSFQITNVFPKLSVFENVRIACLRKAGYYYSLFRMVSKLPHVKRAAEEILDATGLQNVSSTPAGALTYSEQRSLEIALTLASGGQTVLLDEPTAGMSRDETFAVTNLIKRIAPGRTLVIIEHDMDVVFSLSDRISVLVYGEVIASDTPDRVRADPRVQEAYLGDGLH